MRASIRHFVSAGVCALVVWQSGSAQAQNYGDAPAPYPTAEHTQVFERFGDTRLVDTVNPVTPAWTGSTDDDGISFGEMTKGQNVTITVNIQSLFAQDDIGLWIDWNDNGIWEASERVIWAGFSPSAPDGTLVEGDNVFQVAVPAGAVGTTAKVRARIWDTNAPGANPVFGLDGGGVPDGVTQWGEVEDYEVTYFVPDDPEIDVQRPAGAGIPSGTTDLAGPLTAGIATTLTWTVANQGPSSDLVMAGAQPVTISGEANCSAAVTQQPSSPLAAGNATTFSIDVTPTAGGAFSFDVTVANTDPNESPYTFTVSGQGGITGTFLVSNDAGESPDFADLGEAFNFLEAAFISGPVTLVVSEGSGPYTSTADYALGDTPLVGLSDTNTLTIRAQTGERPRIDGADATTAQGDATLALIDVSFVSVEGLELTGGTGFGLAVTGNTAGISDVTIAGNRIHGVSQGSGIAVWALVGSVTDVAIVNNMVWDVAVGAAPPPFPGTPGAIVLADYGVGVVIRHNTVVVNTATSTGAVLSLGPAPLAVDDVSYNIFVTTSTGIDLFESAAAPNNADYNIYYSGGGGAFSGVDATLAAWQVSSGLDGNSVSSDPSLVSIVNPIEDLHLRTTSFAAIDAAVGSTEGTDIDGDTRPLGPGREIGADEIFVGPTAPTITVLLDGTPLTDGASIGATVGDSIAGLNLSFVVLDPNTGDTLDLVATVTNSANITGFAQSEWDATGTGGSISTSPAAGTFAGLGAVTIQLDADDNTGLTDSFTFTIDVNNSAPALTVTSGGTTVNPGDTLTVNQGETLASLSLVFTATDSDTGDVLDLSSTLLNVGAINGRVSSEWAANGSGGTVTAMPSSGTFTGTGTVTITVNVDDGASGSASLLFHIAINGGPDISVTSGTTGLANGGTLTVAQGSSVADLELTLSVNDTDVGDTLDLTAVVTTSSDITGFVQAEWDATGTGGSISASPATGTFDTPGTITVALSSSDNTGGTGSFSFDIIVDGSPAIAVTAGGNAVANNDVLMVDLGSTVAELGLQFTVNDPNPNQNLTVSTTVVDSADIRNFTASEWAATGNGGSVSASPTTGTFDRIGQIEVSVAANDTANDATPLSFTIAVSERGNEAPTLDMPSVLGDIVLGGSGTAYTGSVDVGGDIGLSLTATDSDGDEVTITVARTGGTLLPAQAGIDVDLPVSSTPAAGSSSLSLAGEAQQAGDIELTITVTDDRGGMSRYTLVLTVSDGGDDGCGCRASSPQDSRGTLVLALLVAAVVVRRRKRGLVG